MHTLSTENDLDGYIKQIRKSIVDVYNLTFMKFDKKFDERITLPLYNEGFKNKYLSDVWVGSSGYAATKMIRRTVGEVKVLESEVLQVFGGFFMQSLKQNKRVIQIKN